MLFCPKCGTRVVPTHKNVGKGVQGLWACPRCGYEVSVASKAPAVSRVIEHSPREQISVIGEEEAGIKTMPTVKVECPKCGNLGAYWWIVQTRGTDESPTQFFRCIECSYTWREMA